MYIETTENVRKIFDKLEKFKDTGKLKFTIYVFDSLNTGHINSKNELNPELTEDDDLVVFNLDMVGLTHNFAEIYLEYLTMEFNNIATMFSKGYQENGNVMGNIPQVLASFSFRPL